MSPRPQHCCSGRPPCSARTIRTELECLLDLGAERLELGEIDGAREALRMAAGAADQRQAVLAEVLMCRADALTLIQNRRIDDYEQTVADAVRAFKGGAMTVASPTPISRRPT